jgi:hypothetical protein
MLALHVPSVKQQARFASSSSSFLSNGHDMFRTLMLKSTHAITACQSTVIYFMAASIHLTLNAVHCGQHTVIAECYTIQDSLQSLPRGSAGEQCDQTLQKFGDD